MTRDNRYYFNVKRYILFAFFSICTSGVFAQDQIGTDKAIKQWISSFNHQKYEEVYNLYSSGYKAKMTLANQIEMLKDIYGMMGKLKSAKFISYKEYVYKYIFYANKNQKEAAVTIVIDKDLKFNYLTFDSIGGTGDPPRAARQQN